MKTEAGLVLLAITEDHLAGSKKKYNLSLSDNIGKETKIYLNGELKNTNTWTGEVDASNSKPLGIGSSVSIGNGMADFMIGNIDDLAIYQTVLTAEQIRDLAKQW